MKSGAKWMACALLGLLIAPTINAGANNSPDEGPYGSIIVRNIFDLQQPPPPPPPPPGPKPPPPNVKLVGLMTITGHPQAVIWFQPPGNPPKPVTTVMVAGQRQDDIEVLEIDPVAKSAKVQIDDNIMSLKLEDKPVTSSPVPQMAVGPGGIQRPAMPGAGQPGFGGPRKPAISPRGAADNGAVPTPGLPTRPVRTDTTQEPQLTPEQQMILMEAQRDQAIRNHDPMAAIIPPTPLQQLLNPSSAGGNQPAAAPPPLPGR